MSGENPGVVEGSLRWTDRKSTDGDGDGQGSDRRFGVRVVEGRKFLVGVREEPSSRSVDYQVHTLFCILQGSYYLRK